MSARILVTGSRDWTDGAVIEDALRPFLYEMPGAVLVHGACRGADNIASAIWRGWGGRDEPHIASWATHGKAAGFVRNRSMVDLGADPLAPQEAGVSYRTIWRRGICGCCGRFWADLVKCTCTHPMVRHRLDLKHARCEVDGCKCKQALEARGQDDIDWRAA